MMMAVWPRSWNCLSLRRGTVWPRWTSIPVGSMPYLTRKGWFARSDRSSFLRNSSSGTICSTPRRRMRSCSSRSGIVGFGSCVRPGRDHVALRTNELAILGLARGPDKVAEPSHEGYDHSFRSFHKLFQGLKSSHGPSLDRTLRVFDPLHSSHGRITRNAMGLGLGAGPDLEGVAYCGRRPRVATQAGSVGELDGPLAGVSLPGCEYDCLAHLRRGHGPAASASRQSGREPGRRPGARQGDRQVEERRESTITGGSLRCGAEQGREGRTARSGPRRFDGTIASRADVSICREQWPVARSRSSIRAVDVGSGPGGPWPASAGVAAADGNRRARGDADDATRLRDSVSHGPDLALPGAPRGTDGSREAHGGGGDSGCALHDGAGALDRGVAISGHLSALAWPVG